MQGRSSNGIKDIFEKSISFKAVQKPNHLRLTHIIEDWNYSAQGFIARPS